MPVFSPVPCQVLAERVFTIEDQQRFATFSGDRNPVHVDVLAARRTQAGTLVVHGMHQLLWALEQLPDAVLDGYSLVGVEVRFHQFLTTNEKARISLIKHQEGMVRVSVTALETMTANVTLYLGRLAAGVTNEELLEPVGEEAHNTCRDLRWDELDGLSGELFAWSSPEEARNYFPRASSLIGATRVLAIAAVSRLVGMVCPGMHSFLSAAQLNFSACTFENKLSFRVSLTDKRFSHLKQAVRGLGVEGVVEGFMRQPPVEQDGLAKIRTRVTSNEFAGTIALVVGASRGLGQVVARLVAAGGGHVIATYHVGRTECEQLADEIKSFGGTCDILRYDVGRPAAEQLSGLQAEVTSVYYFATGKISERGELYDETRFRNFVRVYLDGFYQLCRELRPVSGKQLTIVYPSTVYVEERPSNMTTYAMAKAAGEILCKDLSRFWPGLKILSPRIPRVATDQTAALANSAEVFPSAVEVMLPIVRHAEHLRAFEGPASGEN